jgi:L-asparaginase
VPPWWLPAIRAAIEAGVTVVVASRAGSGAVTDRYGYAGCHRDLAELGCLFAHNLNGQKARIRLMVVLGVAQEGQGARRMETIVRLWTPPSIPAW